MELREGGTGPGLGCCRMGARRGESQHEIHESAPCRSASQLAEQFAGLRTSGTQQLEPGAHGLSLDVQDVEKFIGKACFLFPFFPRYIYLLLLILKALHFQVFSISTTRDVLGRNPYCFLIRRISRAGALGKAIWLDQTVGVHPGCAGHALPV